MTSNGVGAGCAPQTLFHHWSKRRLGRPLGGALSWPGGGGPGGQHVAAPAVSLGLCSTRGVSASPHSKIFLSSVRPWIVQLFFWLGAKSGTTYVSLLVTSYHFKIAFFSIQYLLRCHKLFTIFRVMKKLVVPVPVCFSVFLWEDRSWIYLLHHFAQVCVVFKPPSSVVVGQLLAYVIPRVFCIIQTSKSHVFPTRNRKMI